MTEFDDLKLRLEQGSLSRRDFVGRTAALGVGAATLAGLPEFAQAADAPRKGGHIRLGLAGGSTTDSIDPRSWTDTVMVIAGFGCYNGLLENDASNRPIPELAESWESRKGAVEWIFNLRKGVKFTNGKEFDADDAIYSLNLHRGQTKSGAAGPMKLVKDIRKLGPYQIVIELESADADLPYVITDYHLMMVPNGHTDWSKPIGTGGYTIEQFQPGVRITGKRNPNYWKKNAGWFDSYEITVISDTSARMNALISGQLDLMNRCDPRTVSLLTKNNAIDVMRSPGGWHPVMAMQTDTAPYNNVDLRMAMKYAIDREQITKTLFASYGSVGNDHPIPKGDPFFHKELPQLKYDSDKAKFHLKKSGLADAKIMLQASDAAFSGAVDMCTLFQASAQKAGMKVDVKKEPVDGFWDNVWLKGAFVTSYWSGRPAATQMLGVAYKGGAPWNESHWNNTKFDKLLTDARGETDSAKRKDYIWAMQEMLSKEGGVLVPGFRDYLSAHSKKVGGVTIHNGFDLDNGRLLEKAWLKA